MNDDNIFDEDEALDYIVYDELKKEENNKTPNGCLSGIILLVIPTSCLSLMTYVLVNT